MTRGEIWLVDFGVPLVTALDKNCFLEKNSKMPANYLKMICKGVIEVLES